MVLVVSRTVARAAALAVARGNPASPETIAARKTSCKEFRAQPPATLRASWTVSHGYGGLPAARTFFRHLAVASSGCVHLVVDSNLHPELKNYFDTCHDVAMGVSSNAADDSTDSTPSKSTPTESDGFAYVGCFNDKLEPDRLCSVVKTMDDMTTDVSVGRVGVASGRGRQKESETNYAEQISGYMDT